MTTTFLFVSLNSLYYNILRGDDVAFEIKIDAFEGPLDLMLHLVKENKLDLFDLDMNVLCEQYLAYINAMESMHLEVASEFLSELAGMIEYKSKKMLPKEKVEIEEEYEEDQRDKLVKRLIEYQRFKEVSMEFSKKYEERQLLMSKPISDKTSEWISTPKEEDFEGNPYDLIKAMNRVIRRMSLEMIQETNMQVHEMSTEDRLDQIKQRFQKLQGKINFEELCSDCTSLHMVIVSFLAILDMIRSGDLNFKVHNDDIWLMRGDSVDA